MSSERDKKNSGDGVFSEVWDRILSETDIRTLSNLGKVIGKSQQNVSVVKQKNLFPPGWAYLVAKKYGLLTEWLLTGEGPKTLRNFEILYKHDYLAKIDSWLSELVKSEPTRKYWFECSFEDCFPIFREWKKSKYE